MSYSKELREKLARLSVELRAIVSTAKADNNRGLNSEEQTKFNALEKEYTATEESIKSAERVDSIELDLRKVPTDKIAATLGEEVYGAEAEKANKQKHNAAFSKYLRHGIGELSMEERASMRSVGEIKNAQTLTTTGGGYLIPQGFSDKLEEALKWFGGILGNVDEFTTESGNPLPWPTVNDTGNSGGIIAINTQVTETDLVFGQTTFNAYIFSSDSVLVPLALMQDSYFDLDSFIAKALGTRIGRKLNNKLTVGSGTNEPTGLQTATIAAGNISTGATGETTSVIYDDLVNTMHLVDPAYRQQPDAKWMFHDSTLKVLRKLKDGSSRPLWQPALGAGFGNGFPETILDKPYVINNDMPVMAANAYSILFGALKSYKARRVAGGTTVLRLVERYADYLQVGFIGFLRADGNLLDAGTHPMGAFRNSAT
jgi:HK97 family phage major capsid protein